MNKNKPRIVNVDAEYDRILAIEKKKYNKNSAKYRKNFWEFAKYMSNGFFRDTKEPLRLIAETLEDVFAGKKSKVMINIIYRTGKSFLVTLFLAWWLGHNPEKNILRMTNTKELYKKFSRDLRKIIKMDKYKAIFPHIKLASDHFSVEKWALETSREAAHFGNGLEGTIMGEGADICVMDDPVESYKQSLNDLAMKDILKSYTGDIRSRFAPNTLVPEIIIMTKYGDTDLCAEMLKLEGTATLNGKEYDESTGKKYTGKWHVFNFEALKNEGTKYEKSFCEDIWRTELLQEKREIALKVDAPEQWYCMVQQRNYEGKNKPFKHLKWYDFKDANKIIESTTIAFGMKYTQKAMMEVIIDPADEGLDKVAVAFWALVGNERYLMDVIYTSDPYKDHETDVVNTIDKYGKYIKKILYEANGLGAMYSIALMKELDKKNLTKIPDFVGFKSKEKKLIRIRLNTPDIKRECRFPELHTIPVDHPHYHSFSSFITDLRGFNVEKPKKHTLDAVDCCSQSVQHGSLNEDNMAHVS